MYLIYIYIYIYIEGGFILGQENAERSKTSWSYQSAVMWPREEEVMIW
jgi:hypothetical protein